MPPARWQAFLNKRGLRMNYLIIIEKTQTGFSAYCPDLPGCIAAGETEGQVMALMKDALEFHLEGLKDQGFTVPEPTSKATLLELAL